MVVGRWARLNLEEVCPAAEIVDRRKENPATFIYIG
jgi:hypothetical protein